MLDSERHSRQIRFAPIGPDGQARLTSSRVAIVGCGALGSAAAEQLCRAGVGALTLIDRDFVEHSNLQRQTLYTEEDAAAALPKSVAATRRLAAIDHRVRVMAMVEDVRPANIERLLSGHDLVLDGTDNFATRHLINDACCKSGIPWIYGACVGAYGCSVAILPGETPCLRCLQDQLPAAGDTPTCDTSGIIAPAVHLVSAWQVAEALKLLVGRSADVRRELWTCDLWASTWQRLRLDRWRDPACASCGPAPTHPALAESVLDQAVVLCGRDAIQIRRATAPELALLARNVGDQALAANEYLVRWRDGDLTATCFRDGRVIVQGSSDLVVARALCDRWLG
jgi:sulfur carrier protein ThiS adenylyltransferase